ncbi:MAG TPA: DUF5985 family protein [Actinomycetota bacterium]|nr:DUF5985 family protein [Actinomycetota bacterium]
MDDFLSGVIATLSATAGLMFWKYWRQARDRLFSFFSGAFFLLSLHYVLLTFNPRDGETRPYLYLIRLAAFVSIIVGVIDKNRKDIHE